MPFVPIIFLERGPPVGAKYLLIFLGKLLIYLVPCASSRGYLLYGVILLSLTTEAAL